MLTLNELINNAAKIETIPSSIAIPTEEILRAQSVDDKISSLKGWLSKKQPCLFGRLAASSTNTLGVNICWITESDISDGDEYVRYKIQQARRAWKDKASKGLSHGFLLMFSSFDLSRITPGPDIIAVATRMAELLLPEISAIETEIIYTEAIPLLYLDGTLKLHKGGINMFYTTAHGTLNHDRRIPGGILFSINAPGHYAQSLFQMGKHETISESLKFVYNLTIRSIGNGGIENSNPILCTWHRIIEDHDSNETQIATDTKKLPNYIPKNYDKECFSGNYHTDILIPRFVTENFNTPASRNEYVWDRVYYGYFSEKNIGFDDPDYGWIVGHPISSEAIYFNPWPPERPTRTIPSP